MHIENLKIFSDLVESESFSKAAKLNGITQSAVSQQLQAMEKHFETLIVDRSQKQFRLTREGHKLYESSKDIVRRYDMLFNELQEMKKVVSGSVRIATIYSVGLHELPPYLNAFMKRYPAVKVDVEYRRSNLVYEDVLHNSVDLGIVAYPSRNNQLEVIPFKDDYLVLVVSVEHPLASKPQISLSALKGQKFIHFDKDIPTRKAIDRVFEKVDLEIEPVMEFDNIETVKRAVEINAGVAILPASTITTEESKGLLKGIPIRGADLVRPIAAIHRKGRVLSPALKRFICMLQGEDPDGE